MENVSAEELFYFYAMIFCISGLGCVFLIRTYLLSLSAGYVTKDFVYIHVNSLLL